jgi:cytochrome c oxidase subunit 2
VLLVSAVLAIVAFLAILALQVPAGTPAADYPAQIVSQLQTVWASFFPPASVTEQGAKTHDLYTFVFIIAAVVFLLVEGLIVWAVVRYRRKPTDTELPPQIHGNNVLEIVWTIIPTAIVALLFVLSWQTLNVVDQTKAAEGEVRIRATAARFQWTFQYISPADNKTILFDQLTPEMVVPAGRTVHLALYSPDVIHAFYVPQFLFKRDVVPGKENVFDFTVDPAMVPPGPDGATFKGQCAELCGPQHWAMQFTVKALEPAEFDAWLQTQIDAQNAKPSAAPSGAPSGAVLDLSAKDIAYDKTDLEAPADQAFAIKFTNNDAGVSHNVAIRDASGAEKFTGEIFPGVDSRTYAVPALPAGTYTFVCSVHPNMTGTLTVK